MSIDCDTCPGKYTKLNKARHFKTKTHQLYVKPEECVICYEPFGWLRDSETFYYKSGKCFSKFAGECKHYICEDCETGLIRDKCPCEECEDPVTCPLCREDWSDYLMNEPEWLSEAEYDEDGTLVCLKKTVWEDCDDELVLSILQGLREQDQVVTIFLNGMGRHPSTNDEE
jgi:hypothetical protein